MDFNDRNKLAVLGIAALLDNDLFSLKSREERKILGGGDGGSWFPKISEISPFDKIPIFTTWKPSEPKSVEEEEDDDSKKPEKVANRTGPIIREYEPGGGALVEYSPLPPPPPPPPDVPPGGEEPVKAHNFLDLIREFVFNNAAIIGAAGLGGGAAIAIDRYRNPRVNIVRDDVQRRLERLEDRIREARDRGDLGVEDSMRHRRRFSDPDISKPRPFEPPSAPPLELIDVDLSSRGSSSQAEKKKDDSAPTPD